MSENTNWFCKIGEALGGGGGGGGGEGGGGERVPDVCRKNKALSGEARFGELSKWRLH